MDNLMRKLLMEWVAAILYYICGGYTKLKNQLQSLVFIVMYLEF